MQTNIWVDKSLAWVTLWQYIGIGWKFYGIFSKDCFRTFGDLCVFCHMIIVKLVCYVFCSDSCRRNNLHAVIDGKLHSFLAKTVLWLPKQEIWCDWQCVGKKLCCNVMKLCWLIPDFLLCNSQSSTFDSWKMHDLCWFIYLFLVLFLNLWNFPITTPVQ